MTNFCHMNWFQNQYRDYAEIIQEKNQIIFFKDFTTIALFNNQTHTINLIKNIKYNLTEKQIQQDIKFFKFSLQLSDPNKHSHDNEYFHCYSYSADRRRDRRKVLNRKEDGKMMVYKQSIHLRSISLASIKASVQGQDGSSTDKGIKVKE